MKVKFSKTMDRFLEDCCGVRESYQKKFEQKLIKILQRKIKINSKYRLKSRKTKTGQKIWYTQESYRCFRNGFRWAKKITFTDRLQLMKYEFDGNEVWIENTKGIKHCLKKAINAYIQLLYQMNEQDASFITFFMLVPLEGDKGKRKWKVEIRFYEDRVFDKNKDTLWGDIDNLGNPIILVCI